MLEALQVILLIWSVPIELASGFLFGLPLGLLYSTLGHTLGSMLAFLLGRWLGKKYVIRLAGPDKMNSIRRFMQREGAMTAFLIFLLPGIPKDFICYIFGLTRISMIFFLVASTLARLPGSILIVAQGSEVYKGHYVVTLVLLILYLGIAFWTYKYRLAFYQWISRWHYEGE